MQNIHRPGRGDGDDALHHGIALMQAQIGGDPGQNARPGGDFVIQFEHAIGDDAAEGDDPLPPCRILGPARHVVGRGDVERILRHGQDRTVRQMRPRLVDLHRVGVRIEIDARIGVSADGTAIEELDPGMLAAMDNAVGIDAPVLLPPQDDGIILRIPLGAGGQIGRRLGCERARRRRSAATGGNHHESNAGEHPASPPGPQGVRQCPSNGPMTLSSSADHLELLY